MILRSEVVVGVKCDWMRRGLVLTAILFAGSVAGPVWGHPGHSGNDLALRINIDAEAVTYDIYAFGGLLPSIVPAMGSQVIEFSRMTNTFLFKDPEQLAEVKQTAADYFDMMCPVWIDGVKVRPVVEALTLLRSAQPMAAADPYAFPPDLNITLRYPCMGLPKQVRMRWRLFIQDTTRLMLGEDPALPLFADLETETERRPLKFTAAEPENVWHQPTVKPGTAPLPPVQQVAVADPRPAIVGGVGVAAVVTLIAMGVLGFSRKVWVGTLVVEGIGVTAVALLFYVGPLQRVAAPTVALPDDQEAETIFTTLHRNIYRAFDYKSEGDVYDALAQTVTGDLLESIYAEVFQSLVMEEEGGAVAQVSEVTPLAVAVLDRGVVEGGEVATFKVQARWRVLGVVTHFNHSHQRLNEYEAVYAVTQRGEQWKIAGVELLSSERLPPGTEGPMAETPAAEAAS
jgi:hypothetical protein